MEDEISIESGWVLGRKYYITRIYILRLVLWTVVLLGFWAHVKDRCVVFFSFFLFIKHKETAKKSSVGIILK